MKFYSIHSTNPEQSRLLALERLGRKRPIRSEIATAESTSPITRTDLAPLFVTTVAAVATFAVFPLTVCVPLIVTSYFVVRRFACQRKNRETAALLDELPALLNAAAASLKTGATPLGALERGALLLPKESVLCHEVSELIHALHNGQDRGQAIRSFCATTDVPDLELFRSALRLTTEHGGRFSATLEHIAESCRERASLMRSARVTTAIMNMTANFIMVLAPMLMMILSLQQPAFWQTLRSNSIASTTFAIGLCLLLMGYGALKHMSDFKP